MAEEGNSRLWGGKGIGKWWECKVGRVEDATCPRCKEEEGTLDHIVFQREDTGRVDDEGRPVLESVDLMEEFFENIHCVMLDVVSRALLLLEESRARLRHRNSPHARNETKKNSRAGNPMERQMNQIQKFPRPSTKK